MMDGLGLSAQANSKYFPSEDCYSEHAWEIVLELACLVFYELAHSSISIQCTQRSNYLDCHSGDWEYLRYHLQPKVQVVEKFGVSTFTYSCKNGTKEVIKSHLRHLCALFKLQCFLGTP
jgi:hypothetical protein